MSIEKLIDNKIEIAKSDIKVCMDDFNRKEEVNSDYPIGQVHLDLSKSEVYHRGYLLGLESALETLNNPENKTILLSLILNQLDTWIKNNEKSAENMREAGLHQQANILTDYSQAYWNVKQFIEVNYK